MVDGNESWFSVSRIRLMLTLSSSATSISEPTNSVNLIATLESSSSYDVVVNLTYSGTATNGTDYSGESSITISAGKLSGTTAITAIDDTDVESIQTIIVDIESVSGGSEKDTQQVSINLISDDKPSLTLSYEPLNFDEGEGTSVITATISAAHSKMVTLPLSITGTANMDYDYSTSYATKTSYSTVAGGNSAFGWTQNSSNALNELYRPEGFHVDSSDNLYIADTWNLRVIKWAPGATEGVVVAGGSSGGGNEGH